MGAAGATPVASYVGAWRAYRWWARAFWLVFVGFLPGMSLFDRVVRRTAGDAANTATVVAALVWMLGFALAGYQKGNLACPRCGQSFFRTSDDRPWRQGWRSNPFARHCMHCGPAKWAESEAG
jgi:hypothetical protein